MKICILYGGVSAERKISLKTGQAIFDSINDDYNVFLYDFDGDYDFLKNNLNNVDLVFNGLHGGEVETSLIMHLRPDLVRENALKNFSSLKAGAPIFMPKALASLLLAMTHPSLFDNTTTGLFSSWG